MGSSTPSAFALIEMNNYIRKMRDMGEQVTRKVCFSA
jgi:hypothetical protein